MKHFKHTTKLTHCHGSDAESTYKSARCKHLLGKILKVNSSFQFSTVTFVVILVLTLTNFNLTKAQDLSTYEGRKEWVNKTFEDAYGWGADLATINCRPDDYSVQKEIAELIYKLDNQSIPRGVYALANHWDQFPESMKTSMKNKMKTWREIDGHGTENHALMQNFSGYLFTQWFPGESGWTSNAGGTLTSEAMNKRLKGKLLAIFSSLYDKGYQENLSTTYDNAHLFPALALYEFADDPEVVQAAEAAILFHISNIALNNFHGVTIAPYNRSNTNQSNAIQKGVQGQTQFVNWLYWPEYSSYEPLKSYWTSHAFNQSVIYNASVDWTPPAALQKIGSGQTDPYTVYGSTAGFGQWGSGWAHENMRTVYRASQFAVGTGFFRYKPTEYYTNYKNFSIMYESSDVFNYIECVHNYWNSDNESSGWTKCANSPFQENAQDKNTVISLFNIPSSDPWRGVGYSSWTSLRDGHYNNMIQRADIRFPKSIDQKVESDGWIFLREGDVYTAIKPLRGYSIDTRALSSFDIIRSNGATNAVIFEMGTAEEHTSFTDFRNKVKSNKLSVNWNTLEVEYTDSQGDVLKAKWVQPDYSKKTANDRVLVKPEVYRNGVKENNYTAADWPVLKSPYVSLENRVLSIRHGEDSIVVDWTGNLPVKTVYKIENKAKKEPVEENLDCNGDVDGTAYFDDCGRCVAGKTKLVACETEGLIWEVDFNHKDSDGFWRVDVSEFTSASKSDTVDGRYVIQNLTAEWKSEIIDISSFTSVDINMDIEGYPVDMDEFDYLNVYYSVDGGEKTALTEKNGGFVNSTIDISGVTGNYLELIIEGYTSAEDASYFFDNVRVYGNGTATAIDDIFSENEKLSVYPNPATDIVTIEYSDNSMQNSDVNLNIMDVSGAVYHSSIFQGSTNVNISDLAPGVYFIEAGDKVSKIVKI